MDEIIARLKLIKKDDLDERELYEQIIDVIKDIDASQISEEERESIKSTLHEIGCEDFKEWEARHLAAEEEIPTSLSGAEDAGALYMGASCINQFLCGYETALLSYENMIEGGEQKGKLQQWLSASKAISAKEEKAADEDLDY